MAIYWYISDFPISKYITIHGVVWKITCIIKSSSIARFHPSPPSWNESIPPALVFSVPVYKTVTRGDSPSTSCPFYKTFKPSYSRHCLTIQYISQCILIHIVNQAKSTVLDYNAVIKIMDSFSLPRSLQHKRKTIVEN